MENPMYPMKYWIHRVIFYNAIYNDFPTPIITQKIPKYKAVNVGGFQA